MTNATITEYGERRTFLSKAAADAVTILIVDLRLLHLEALASSIGDGFEGFR